MQQFFIKKGKKTKIENQFYNYIKERSFLNKTNTEELLTKSVSNITGFVFLKSRRRGKRVKYKVTYLEEVRGANRAMLSFSKQFKDQHKKGLRFTNLLEKELLSLNSDKNPLLLKRDELHKLALENAPQNWIAESDDSYEQETT